MIFRFKSLRKVNFLKKLMIKDSIIYIVEKFLRLISNFLLSLWIIRIIGPTEFGNFSLALTIVILLFSFSDLGIESIIAKDIKCLEKKRGQIIFTAISLKLIISIFLTIFIALYLLIAKNDFKINYLILILSIGQCISSFGYIESYCIGIKKSYITTKIYFFTNFISIFLKIFTIKLYPNSLGLSISYLYEYSLFAIFSSIYLIRNFLNSNISFDFSIKYTRLLINKAKYLILSNFFSRITLKSEILILGILFEPNLVGVYAASKKIIESLYFIPISIINVNFPNIVKGLNSVNTKYLRNFSKFILLISFLLSFIVYRFRYIIVDYFLTEEYRLAGDLLSFLTWSLLFIPLVVLRKKYFIIVNKKGTLLLYSFLNSLLMISTIFILNFFFSINGIALALCIVFFFSLFIIPNILKTKPWYYFD